jgi:hypothetical protein
MTFIVRITGSGGRLYGVVEQVRTGRKEQVHGIEDIGRVIAALVLGEERAMSLRGKHALVTGGSRGIAAASWWTILPPGASTHSGAFVK